MKLEEDYDKMMKESQRKDSIPVRRDLGPNKKSIISIQANSKIESSVTHPLNGAKK